MTLKVRVTFVMMKNQDGGHAKIFFGFRFDGDGS
jgi:hypothetical protein